MAKTTRDQEEIPPGAERPAGPLERGSSGSTADLAVEGSPVLSERFPDEPYARPAEPLGKDELPDQLAGKNAAAAPPRD